ncbi:hypothetical protein FSP39_003873 [Pinctada imbricata]|uniref:Uncharacterized protein n=1 Tax=Pinctada imbricata TaxID=66713 RepID=A0AA88XCM6_PINIB|nr:hypothetical protein FSP39_003873 [Pinctada imbricata]
MKYYNVIFVMWVTSFVNSVRVEHSLSTYVNFEKYFGIEEELITLADLFLKHELRSHEGEDVHKILNMTSTIDDAKDLHREIGLSYRDYIKHPVNTFLLAKRLATKWREIINRLLESSSCVKDLRVKLQNMEDAIPEKVDFKKIAYSLTNLNLYGGFSLDEIIKGNLNGYAPKQAFSLEDISDIGHASYDREDYYYAYKILSYVYDRMKSNRINELENGITIGNQASRLSSACYKMGHIDKAKAVLSELLKIDSKNKIAKRNLEYYIAVTKKSKTGEPKRKRSTRKSQRYFEEMCRSQIKEMLSKSTRLECLYFPHRKQDVPYQKSRVKAEVLHRTPLIIKFYDVVDNDTAKAVAFMAYKQMSESNIIGYKSSIQSVAVKDRTYWKWVPKLQTKILGLKMSKFPPKLTSFMVNEVGIDGYAARNNSKTKYPPVGMYVTFVSMKDLLLQNNENII